MILTHDEICQLDLERAKSHNLENPNFDFRNLGYKKGDIIYWVHVVNNPYADRIEKELKVLTIQSVYPRVITAYLPKSICYTLFYKDRENIYTDRKLAQKAFKKLKFDIVVEEENNDRNTATDND